MIKNPKKYIYTLILITALVGSRHAVYADNILIDTKPNDVCIGEVNYPKLLEEYIHFLKKDALNEDSQPVDNELINLIGYAEEILNTSELDEDFENIYYKLIDKYNDFQVKNSSNGEYSNEKNIAYYMQVLSNLSISQDNQIENLEINGAHQLDMNYLIDKVMNLLKEESEFKSYKAKLLNAIADANKLALEEVSESVDNTLIYDSIEYAENIYNLNGVDIETLKMAITSIDDTMKNASINYRNELKLEIERAEDILNNIETGTKPGQYTQDSVNKLYAAIYTANQKYDNNKLTEDELNIALQTLKSEITVFENSIIKKPNIDTSMLTVSIQQAEKIIKETTVGNEINQISAGEKEELQHVLDSAIIIAEMSSPTQEVVDDVIKKLNNSIEKAQKTMDNTSSVQEEINNVVNYLESEIDIVENTQITEKIDKSKLELSIEKGEALLETIVIGDGDGETKQDAVDGFKLELNSAKKIAASYTVTQSEVDTATNRLDEAIIKLQQAENTKYTEYMTELKSEIETCVSLYKESTMGLSVGEYPKESKMIFKDAIEKAESVLSSGVKDSNTYIKALSTLQNERNNFEDSKIESSDIDSSMDELNKLLKEMNTLIKTTTVGSVNEGVNENQKIALSVMFSKLNKMVESTDNIGTINNAIELAKNAISDFKDESIYIDDNNNINGRKLTGKIATTSNKIPTTEIIENKEEFIPQAGIPIDIKTILPTLSLGFISIGAILNRKSKK